MQNRISEHAKESGLHGFVAEVLARNPKMIALAKRGQGDIKL